MLLPLPFMLLHCIECFDLCLLAVQTTPSTEAMTRSMRS